MIFPRFGYVRLTGDLKATIRHTLGLHWFSPFTFISEIFSGYLRLCQYEHTCGLFLKNEKKRKKKKNQ